MPLNRAPIYRQLNHALRRLVQSGEFTRGGQFLTERQVAERFGVSRPTANKALASLVSEGLLDFRKGVGTFVADGRMDYDMRSLVSFTDRAKAAGMRPSTRVLQFNQIAGERAPQDVLRKLNLTGRDNVYFIERLRLASGIPMIIERRYVATRLCPNLRSEQVARSLYAIWSDTYGLDVVGAEQTIRAVGLGAADAKLLDVRRGAAALLVVATGFVAGDEPLWTEQTTYRSDRYEFHVHLGGLQSQRPTVGRFAELGVN